MMTAVVPVNNTRSRPNTQLEWLPLLEHVAFHSALLLGGDGGTVRRARDRRSAGLHPLLDIAVVALVQGDSGLLDARHGGEEALHDLAIPEQRALAVVERLEGERVVAVEEVGVATFPGERALAVFLSPFKRKSVLGRQDE